MGLLQTLIYTGLPVVGIILFLLGETSGYNFALKVNLIANFFAPMLAYNIAEMFGIGFVLSPTRAFMFEFIFILLITFFIIYAIAVLSIYKAAGGDVISLADNDKDIANRTKTSCSSFKISSALKHGLKIAFGGVITFFAVANMPSLQQPFVKMASKYSDNSVRIVYSIIGFYMALVSLSTVSFTYFPAIEEGCKMNEQELEDAFSKGYPTLSYLKYERQQKKDKLGKFLNEEQEKSIIKNMMEDTDLLRDKCSIPDEVTGVSKFNINLKEGALVTASGITNITCRNDKGKIYYKGKKYKFMYKKGDDYYLSNKSDKSDKIPIKTDDLKKIYCFDILDITMGATFIALQDIVYKKTDKTNGVLKKENKITITTMNKIAGIVGIKIHGQPIDTGTIDKMYFTSKYFTTAA